jgi:hypothetical protein
MNSGLSAVGSLAGGLGANATGFANATKNTGGNSGTDWSAAGALLGAGLKAWDIWGPKG